MEESQSNQADGQLTGSAPEDWPSVEDAMLTWEMENDPFEIASLKFVEPTPLRQPDLAQDWERFKALFREKCPELSSYFPPPTSTP